MKIDERLIDADRAGLLQPVTTDYLSILDVLGLEPLSTRQVAVKVGLGLEATRTKLHAAEADGYVELLNGQHYTWRKRS